MSRGSLRPGTGSSRPAMADDFNPLSRSDSLHDEMEEALGSLTDRGKLQLLRYARGLARGLGCEAEDLLQEAQNRMLSGSWKWSKDTFKKKLFSVIRSVASTWRDSERSRKQREAQFAVESPVVPYLLDQPPRQQERVDKLREHLLEKDDEKAFVFLEAILEGKNYEEARELAGVDVGQPFNTFMQRLRRQIAKL